MLTVRTFPIHKHDFTSNSPPNSNSSCRTHYDEVICDCPEDFDLDEDLKSCIPTDPCHLNNGGCSHFCDSASDSICSCPQDFELDDDGLVCREAFRCEAGFQPSQHDDKTCLDVNECAEGPNVCLNGHCDNTEGSFHCHCHAGYEASSNKSCVDIDECVTSSPCSHRCLNLPGAYQCHCPHGQKLIEDGHTCGFTDLCDFNNGGCGELVCLRHIVPQFLTASLCSS